MDEHPNVALPKLYGAPAYARPAPSITTTHRPFDPDDLPILAALTEEEESIVATAPNGHAPAMPGDEDAGDDATGSRLRPRPFSIRSFADRLRRARP